MTSIPMTGFNINSLGGNECKLIKGVPADKSWKSFDSLKGRVFCAIAIPLHLIAAGVKPVIYGGGCVLFALTVVVGIITLPIFLCAGLKPDMLFMSTKLLANFAVSCVVSAPLQVFLALKASFGIIDPKMYFTKAQSVWSQPKFDDVFRSEFTFS